MTNLNSPRYRRSPWEIKRDVLTFCLTPRIQDSILRKANVCRMEVKRILTKLINLGFLEIDFQTTSSGQGRGKIRLVKRQYLCKCYHTTEEGRIFLGHINDLLELLKK